MQNVLEITNQSDKLKAEKQNFLSTYGYQVDEDYEPFANEEIIESPYGLTYAVSPSFSTWGENEMRIFRSLL
ncbi:MAG: hypothetical protein AAF378_24600 [Cyanobacteria bacterium P01_A01_bin.84]